MSKRMFLVFLAMALTTAAQSDDALSSGPFPFPTRIRYDGSGLQIDGRDGFVFSGAFPYFQCPKPLWRDRFRKIKEAGLNTVETTVPWNRHERIRPSSPGDYDRMDLSDLADWLRMAHEEFGLNTIVRPGPYVGAKNPGGGFPRWVLAGRTEGSSEPFLRSDNPEYLEWCRHWYRAVCRVVAPEQVTRKSAGKSGVILFQIENQYDLFPLSEPAKVRHLRALYDAARENGIEVPIVTCGTAHTLQQTLPGAGNVFDLSDGDHGNAPVEMEKNLRQLRNLQPRAPVGIAEVRIGGSSGTGVPPDQTPPETDARGVRVITLAAVAQNATVLNYRTADGDSILHASGGTGVDWEAVREIGAMLRVHGAALVRSTPLTGVKIPALPPDVTLSARRATNGDLYFFAHNLHPDRPLKKRVSVEPPGRSPADLDLDLAPLDARMFRIPAGGGPAEILPRPLPKTARPATPPPAPICPATAWMREDHGQSADWKPLPGGCNSLADLGRNELGFTLYRSRPVLSDHDARSTTGLFVRACGDGALIIRINGRTVVPAPPRRHRTTMDVSGLFRAGTNEVLFLYENYSAADTPGGEDSIADPGGLREVRREGPAGKGSPLALEWGGDLPGVTERWYAPRMEASEWKVIPLESGGPKIHQGGPAPETAPPAPAVWYRVDFDLPAPERGVWIPWRARIRASGRGMAYLNGQPIGGLRESDSPQEFYLPECWLHTEPGRRNTLTLCLCPTARGARLESVEVRPYEDRIENR